MRFLVTGSAGLVGRQVVKDLVQAGHETYSCYHKLKPEDGIPISLDLANSESIIKVVDETSPDVILHLGAMTNVDLCEQERNLAVTINAKATEILAKRAAKKKSFLVYVSTDYVFDGEVGMKNENDATNPVGHYGRTKLEGEIMVKRSISKWCIARTSTPYGLHPTRKSFPIFVAENLEAKKEISVVTDQFTSPTYVPNLSRMLIEISEKRLEGILHVAGATRISRYDIARLVAEKLNLDKSLIRPTSIKKMNWIAKRPKDSSLDISKANSILKEKPMTVEKGLDLLVQEMKLKPN